MQRLSKICVQRDNRKNLTKTNEKQSLYSFKHKFIYEKNLFSAIIEKNFLELKGNEIQT